MFHYLSLVLTVDFDFVFVVFVRMRRTARRMLDALKTETALRVASPKWGGGVKGGDEVKGKGKAIGDFMGGGCMGGENWGGMKGGGGGDMGDMGCKGGCMAGGMGGAMGKGMGAFIADGMGGDMGGDLGGACGGEMEAGGNMGGGWVPDGRGSFVRPQIEGFGGDMGWTEDMGGMPSTTIYGEFPPQYPRGSVGKQLAGVK